MAIANLVALKKVVSQHESAPLNDVVKAINIKLNLADQNDNEARTHRVEAGEMLVALRNRVEAVGQDWWTFAKGHFGRERKELEKLMSYVPASAVVKAAIKADPELSRMSDRSVAEKIGVDHKTVAAARGSVGENSPTGKRTGKDGKQYMASKARQQAPALRKMPEPPKIDMDVIKQAGAFHTGLMQYTEEFCARVTQWHAANQIDSESHDCVVQALEMASMRLQRTAQDIDGR